MPFEIQTDTAKMRKDSSEVRNLSMDYNNLAQQIFQEGRELDSCWKGDAKLKFNTQCSQDEPRFAELNQVICSYCDALDESAASYAKTETEIAASVPKH
jgi:WXG100 family type VII secretion target